MALYMRERRASRRDKLIQMAGGRCVKCGSDERLEFDHRVPGTRLFVLSGCSLDKSWQKILDEYAKCDLLCHECHRKKTVECGEVGGGWNKNTSEHGTESMHRAHGCNCDPCVIASHEARVRRGEIKGTKRPKTNG